MGGGHKQGEEWPSGMEGDKRGGYLRVARVRPAMGVALVDARPVPGYFVLICTHTIVNLLFFNKCNSLSLALIKGAPKLCQPAPAPRVGAPLANFLHTNLLKFRLELHLVHI